MIGSSTREDKYEKLIIIESVSLRNGEATALIFHPNRGGRTPTQLKTRRVDPVHPPFVTGSKQDRNVIEATLDPGRVPECCAANN